MNPAPAPDAAASCSVPPRSNPPSPTALDDSTADVDLAGLARALSHPARVTIVRHLSQARGCVGGEIFDLVPLAQSTVSQHLKVLREAGLITGGGEGPRSGYCLDHDRLRQLRLLVAAL